MMKNLLSDWIRGFNRVGSRLGVAASMCLLVESKASIFADYFNDFEALDPASPSALSDDFWTVFANVYTSGGAYIRGYGPFAAPNGSGAFSNVTMGQGGPDQGAQGLVVFSDYNNAGDQGAGNLVEANVFQEDIIAEEDVGLHVFRFDAKAGDLVAPSTASAFIKVLDQNNNFSQTEYLFMDTSALPVEWGSYTIEIDIDPLMVGQTLQFGFSATATEYRSSGVYYDNVFFGVAPDEPMAPPVIASIVKVADVVSVTFPTEAGATYDLLKSTDGMETFVVVVTQDPIAGDGSAKVAVDDAATEASAYYQIRRRVE